MTRRLPPMTSVPSRPTRKRAQSAPPKRVQWIVVEPDRTKLPRCCRPIRMQYLKAPARCVCRVVHATRGNAPSVTPITSVRTITAAISRRRTSASVAYGWHNWALPSVSSYASLQARASW